MQWLTDNEIEGKVIELKTRYHDEDYIISDRIGNDQSITINGKHYGVEVRGRVFDNLSPQGMTRDDWLKNVHSVTLAAQAFTDYCLLFTVH